MKIGIAGVGGIGSNVAMNLVRSGILDLKYGDFDIIDESNLNRQFYFQDQIGQYKVDALFQNLKRININVNIEKQIIKFDSNNLFEYFSDCEIIVEGFDNKETKSMLIETFLHSNKKIISASGIADINTDNVMVRKFSNNTFAIGDGEKDINDFQVFSHKVNLIAAKIAELVIKLNNEVKIG